MSSHNGDHFGGITGSIRILPSSSPITMQAIPYRTIPKPDEDVEGESPTIRVKGSINSDGACWTSQGQNDSALKLSMIYRAHSPAWLDEDPSAVTDD